VSDRLCCTLELLVAARLRHHQLILTASVPIAGKIQKKEDIFLLVLSKITVQEPSLDQKII
jgi:hypothetical protein